MRLKQKRLFVESCLVVVDFRRLETEAVFRASNQNFDRSRWVTRYVVLNSARIESLKNESIYSFGFRESV